MVRLGKENEKFGEKVIQMQRDYEQKLHLMEQRIMSSD